MNNYFEVLTEAIKELDMKYWMDEEQKMLRTGFKIEEFRYDLFFSVLDELNVFKITVPKLKEFPEEKAFDVLSLINKHNKRMIFGSFRINKRKDEKYYVEFGHCIHFLKEGENPTVSVKELSDVFKYTAFEIYDFYKKYDEIIEGK